jgi:hypothetical protein
MITPLSPTLEDQKLKIFVSASREVMALSLKGPTAAWWQAITSEFLGGK